MSRRQAPQPPRFVRRKATALRYDPSRDKAPRVTAKGQGVVADQILEAAEKHGVPVRKDPFLVEALSTLDLGKEIPPQLYRTVAELLFFVYRLNEEWRKRS